ncbi:sensor domain-containing protein [Ornithinibacillus contaminans]|uniref:sensor domain-containing protein n=1 Tax=Ornithinibacillus contaminans TaxID=694055 RepID=UPI00069F812F|nr:EAL domain-containing protein [Ornithinibacillus contaminans]
MAEINSTKSDILRLLFQHDMANNNISQDTSMSDAVDSLLSFYAAIGSNHPDSIMVFSPDGELRSNNQKRFLTKPIHKLEDFKPFLLKKSYEQVEEIFYNARNGNTERCEIQLKRRKQFYEIFIIPVQNIDTNVDGIVLIARDITDYKLSHLQSVSEIQSYKHIVNHLNMGVWVSEYKTGNLTFVSERLAALYEYPLDDFFHKYQRMENVIQAAVLPEDRERITCNEKDFLLKGEPVRFRIQCGDGSVKWIICQMAPHYDDAGNITHIFGMQTDITEEVKLQEQFQYTANHDLLTTLPNRRSLYQKLDTLLGNETPFAVLFFNLDRFSVINGTLGYQVGDSVLKTIATRLIVMLPEKSFIARLESNDFIIVFEDYTRKDQLIRMIKDILIDIKHPLTVNGYEINITTSIGISMYPDDGETKEILMDKAHAALTHAKKSGKSTYQLYSDSNDNLFQRKLAIEKDMLEALEKEEFELYYQPLVETQSGTILGAEALIRWNHQEWGMIPPGEFIPIAEENQLICEISDWVIKKACAQLRAWQDKGLEPIPISVNISPIRLMKKGLTEFVKSQLATYQVPADYLGVEITEGSLLKSEKGVLATIAELKELGVRIAIDDFGTGFASLNYLREYQADTLKIDQVFIQSRDGQVEKDNIIVGSVMQMAKALNMRIIAEGVEEIGQYRFLRNRECDLIQGYLFSGPVPVHQFEHFLKEGYLEPDPEKVEKDRLRRIKS